MPVSEIEKLVFGLVMLGISQTSEHVMDDVVTRKERHLGLIS